MVSSSREFSFTLFSNCELCGELFVLESLEHVHRCQPTEAAGESSPAMEFARPAPTRESPVEVQKQVLPEPIVFGRARNFRKTF
jgi:hypothetical protein